jgi:hypothetical protein
MFEGGDRNQDIVEDGDRDQDTVEGSDMDQDAIEGGDVEQDSRSIVLFVVSWACGVLATFHSDLKFITITFYIESCFHTL